jgi:hypothetical protein
MPKEVIGAGVTAGPGKRTRRNAVSRRWRQAGRMHGRGARRRGTGEITNTRILSIDPGSTFTGLGLLEGERAVFKETLHHDVEELAQYTSCSEQLRLRKDRVLSFLSCNGVALESLAAVIGRGGLDRPGCRLSRRGEAGSPERRDPAPVERRGNRAGIHIEEKRDRNEGMRSGQA